MVLHAPLPPPPCPHQPQRTDYARWCRPDSTRACARPLTRHCAGSESGRCQRTNMEQELHMVGGEDKTSYAKNSWFQRWILDKVEPTLDDCIGQLVREMGSNLQRCLKVVDMGCSSGPNVFCTAKNIIKSVDKHYENVEEMLTIQYFLNDLVSNDFNLIFKGLPEFYEKNRGCIIAAVPGTFYGKLFPDESMHFFHSSCCIHWLSQAPKGLVTETGISMNKLNIYCGKTSPPMVQKEYENQFRYDFSVFLRMRCRELVPQGQLLLTFNCENSDQENTHHFLPFMESALIDMVTEGCIEKEKLENYNVPMHFPSVGEVREIIKDDGCFEVLKLHCFKIPLDSGYEFWEDDDDHAHGRARYVASYIRAAFEPILTSHFGEAIIDDLFHRFAAKFVDALHTGKLHYLDFMVVSLKKVPVLDYIRAEC